MDWAPQLGWSTLSAMLNSGRAVALRQHPTARRLGRFALSSITVQVVYAALMTVFLLGLDLPRQAALAIGYAGALGVHFTLNRQFVFAPADGYTHGLTSHGSRYLVSAVVVYVITAFGLALLPDALGLAPYIAWLLLATPLGAVNYVLLGRFVFR
jgi:putative flippase GtrA